MRAATTVVEGAPILTPDQGFTAPRADHSETGDFLLTFFWFMKKKYMLKVKINTYSTECVSPPHPPERNSSRFFFYTSA